MPYWRTAGLSSALVVVVLGSAAFGLRCPFQAMTGLDCPMCGGTRAVVALMHGQVPTAFGFNAFAVAVIVPLLVVLVVRGARMESGRASQLWPSGFAGVSCAVALGAGLLVWTVVRNLPFAPFVALRS